MARGGNTNEGIRNEEKETQNPSPHVDDESCNPE
jgi:hypothetical protein